MLIGQGAFEGRGSHQLTGTFTLTRDGDTIRMETDADFFFDGSPEPDWALFAGVPVDKDDPAVRSAAVNTRFGNMPGGIVEVRGVQTGVIMPASKLEGNDTLFLWCYAIPSILGVGPITLV